MKSEITKSIIAAKLKSNQITFVQLIRKVNKVHCMSKKNNASTIIYSSLIKKVDNLHYVTIKVML